LLPAGVKQVSGTLSRGDTVSVVDLAGGEIARGLVAYDSSDASRIAGLKSADIEKAIGFRGRDEIIHRDDLVMTNGERL
jgi:glutamate 5-kinase